MENRDLSSYEMILRVGTFGAEQAASFPPTSLGSELFARVSAAATKLGNHVAKQFAGSFSAREGTASKAVARAALREALERIRRTARAMSEVMPELEAKFRLPRRPADQELLGIAEAVATDAIPLKNDFIRYGMPADFLEELAEHVAEFRSALTGQQSGRGKQVMATAVIDDTLGEAISDVRQLDAIVRNTFADDPGRLAAWTTARHVQRQPRTKAPSLTPPVTTQPATPAPPAS